VSTVTSLNGCAFRFFGALQSRLPSPPHRQKVGAGAHTVSSIHARRCDLLCRAPPHPAGRPCRTWPVVTRLQERVRHVYAAGGVGPGCRGCGTARNAVRARDRAHCRRDHRARLSTGMCACGRRCGELLPWPRGVAHGGPCRYARRISLPWVRQQRGQVCAARDSHPANACEHHPARG